jgi:hypothetical protein
VNGQRAAGDGRALALVALLVVVAVIAFTQSYQRWLDPIIDTGRDLYIPEQLAHGARLYRDIRYQYPPLAPYLLAAITSVIGPSLPSYTAIGLLQSMVIAAALWMIGRRTAGMLGGFTAAILFIALSFCGASTWGANFLFPYSYAATIGMALLVVSLTLFIFERPSFALMALFAASWCKVEYAVAAAVVILILAAGRRITIRQVVSFVIADIVASMAALLYFPHLGENIFAEALTRGESARRFFSTISGIAEWQQNLGGAILAIAGIAVIVWLLRSVRPQVAIPLVIIVSLFLASHAFFRAWAILQIVALVQGFRERNGTLLTLSAFSIASTLRIPLSVSPAWYGFALIVPVYALIAYVLFGYLPLREKAIWWIPLIALLCGRDLAEQRVRYALKAFMISSPRGTFYDANPDRARVLNEFIAQLHGGTLAVLPEGITLNYLSGTRTTLTFHTFTPVETADPKVEDSIIAEFAARPPDRVAIVSRDVREYGYQGFGVDYDQRLSAYLTSKYSLERRWSAPRFQLYLLTLRR